MESLHSRCRGQFDLPFQWELKAEDPGGSQGLVFDAVDIEGDLGLIGVDLHLRHGLGALYIPAAAQVNKRLIAPIGAVEIVGVLTDQTVHRYQAFLILTGSAALVAGCYSEIKHIP